VMVIFKIVANARRYVLLRLRSAYLSRYTKLTKRTDLRKPAASNSIYPLLATVLF